MTTNGYDVIGERLELRSQISDLAQIPAWIERLADRHGIPENTQFAMNLCLEEVLSNIIRHGYAGQPGHSIGVRFSRPRSDYFTFVVEDQAPPFNPVTSPELPLIADVVEEVRVGGQGIRLLRRFSDSLDYLYTPTGNRLTIGFSSAQRAIA